MVRVIEDMFGIAVNPMTQKTDQVRRFTLSTDRGMCVSIITLGAIIQRINVPDVDGKLEDVCLGYDDVAGYYRNQPAYFGATIGRVANRVARGRFKLCGKEVSVSRNFRDKYQLHGGFVGFDSVIWDVVGIHKDGVTFQHVSPDGHEGYPGEVTVNINFSLNDTGCFGMRIEARAKATTCVNITNHAYFNLAGHGSGRDTLLQHMLMIKAQKIVDTDLEQIPTGKLMRIRNTPYDFSSLVNLGKRIGQLANCPIHGFDNNYCVDVPPNRVQLVARVVHPCSGRFMEVHTNQPGVQFYTANNLPDEERGGVPNIGKAGAHYVRHGSFCLETQKYPDAMNHDDFPSIVLNPGQLYDHQVVYRFGACPKRI
ncbi:aldose 1-epimerase [Drosophila miranda]|uniref:Aldose 1-epimerase n=1 Tax=Drosophila pseudoobscura pseudoobscura TaxID=46245 RepID=Q2M097_DROPS|nr:aldose 1-epimerase [Drosophila pseudoobscura]XP_017139374.1 aldose 1-epimerase [Drosophila miranda]